MSAAARELHVQRAGLWKEQQIEKQGQEQGSEIRFL